MTVSTSIVNLPGSQPMTENFIVKGDVRELIRI